MSICSVIILNEKIKRVKETHLFMSLLSSSSALLSSASVELRRSRLANTQKTDDETEQISLLKYQKCVYKKKL